VNRQQLAHLLRSACTVAHDVDVLVLGSQSILGSFDEADLPPEATASQEADIAFLDDPRRDKADEVEGAIGEMSTFHEENGIYAEGVHIEVAILPDGWKDRLVSWDLHPQSPPNRTFWIRTTSRSQSLLRGVRRTTTSSWRSFVVGCSMRL
jgi:hypothetical protein